MTISVGQSIAIIAVCAACTFLERWLPWLLFGHRAVPKVVEYLGKILPMAVMVSLLVYCLRGMQFTSAGAWVPQVIAVGVTACLHSNFGRINSACFFICSLRPATSLKYLTCLNWLILS